MKNYPFTFYKNDKKINELINKEFKRQKYQIILIASENYASPNVIKTQGSCLTNKYAEGYPKNRYYSGCEYVDEIENLAINRAKKLFSADYANVQPYSGSIANIAIYNCLLNPGDKILSMNLSHGGHITHGLSSNISGKLYKFIHYGVNKNGDIDYNQLYKLAIYHKPKMIIGGFSSYSRIIKWNLIKKISDKINAYFLADISHVAGLIAAKIYPNPIDFADVVTSTTHKTLGGPRGGIILSKNKDKNFYKKIDSSIFPGLQGGPLLHVIAAKAVAFKEAMSNEFKKYQINIINNAKIMSKIFLLRDFKLISNIINNHIILINLENKNINGEKASNLLSLYNIIVNKNLIPNDKLSCFKTSGIRIGTSSISRRKISKKYIELISNWICDIIENQNNKDKLYYIKDNIKKICIKFPIY